MKKLWVPLLAFLALLPLTALAELNYEIKDQNHVYFPDLSGMTAYFEDAEYWIFVTPENLDEHLDMVLARGGTEEEIRARYARESFVFEAYYDQLPADTCVRLEMFETNLTRDMWHTRHMDLDKRTLFFEDLEMGFVMPWYDVFSPNIGSTGSSQFVHAQFTSIPPATLESGSIRMWLINGKMYVFSYNVSGRLIVGNTKSDSAGTGGNSVATPVGRYQGMAFSEELLPQLPAFELNGGLPAQADVGDMTVKGTIRSGGTIRVELDGVEVPVTLKSYEGEFTAVLPLTTEGDHEVRFIVNHPKNTERVETATINVSSTRTALTFTRAPQGYVLAGEQILAGVSDPGASIVITLDENEPVTLTADENGAFSWSVDLPGDALHHIHVMATAPDYKDSFNVDWYFLTVYETTMDGLYAFGSKLSGTLLKDLIADPMAHVDERVKVEAHIMRVDIIPEGLGLYCKEYQNYYYQGPERYFYVTINGYAQGQPHELMVLDVYGTVEGQREVEGEMLLEISMQYATYTVYK